MMSSSDTVKKVRIALNLNQTDLAGKLNLSKTAIYNYERGARRPNFDVIKRIKTLANENGVEISIDDFLNKG